MKMFFSHQSFLVSLKIPNYQTYYHLFFFKTPPLMFFGFGQNEYGGKNSFLILSHCNFERREHFSNNGDGYDRVIEVEYPVWSFKAKILDLRSFR